MDLIIIKGNVMTFNYKVLGSSTSGKIANTVNVHVPHIDTLCKTLIPYCGSMGSACSIVEWPLHFKTICSKKIQSYIEGGIKMEGYLY